MSGFFICPNCDSKVPAKARACPECGSDEHTGWSRSPAVGGIFADGDDDRGRAPTASGWLRLGSIVLIALVAFGAVSSLGRRGMIALPILLLVAAVGYVVTKRRPTLNLGFGREQQAYGSLLNKARGDQALAERLIAYEQRRMPNASRQQLIQNAIDRWDRDNR